MENQELTAAGWTKMFFFIYCYMEADDEQGCDVTGSERRSSFQLSWNLFEGKPYRTNPAFF